MMSKFASDIMKQKYSHLNKEGEIESWENIAFRVSKHVLKSVHAPASQIEKTRKLIEERKFIPGGRYLAATGRLSTKSIIASCSVQRTAGRVGQT